jgi:hypothetical protein
MRSKISGRNLLKAPKRLRDRVESGFGFAILDFRLKALMKRWLNFSLSMADAIARSEISQQ